MKRLTYKRIKDRLFKAMANSYGDTDSINGVTGNFSVGSVGRTFIIHLADYGNVCYTDKETATKMMIHLEDGGAMPLSPNDYFA